MAKKLQVGIIGTGGISGAHINGYQKLPGDCEIVSVCDVNAAALKEVGERLSIPESARFTDYNKMLSKGPALDIVSVCTPNNYHKDPTIAALKAGAHVLCEKPIAGNAADGEAMAAAARKAGKRLMIGLHNRWHANAQAIKSFIDKGALGNIYHAKAIALRRRGVPSWGRFIEKDYSTGGPLIDIGVHILDLTMYMLGHPKPTSVMGFTYDPLGKAKPAQFVPWGPWRNKDFDVEDYAVGLVRFDGGLSLLLEAGWAMNMDNPNGANEEFNFKILGDKGGAQLTPTAIYGEANGYLTNTLPVHFPNTNGHEEEVRRFIEAIKKGPKAPTPTPAEDAVLVQKILDGIYESSQKGCEVKIS